uniref:Uncharacterized protein n=1 Tax=Klebsiella pneumoniae TaxID=573 RepID=A0A8B0SXG7_KLEPN|nr:hypothetical protein [Klebsiella pneumoniae]
MICLAFHTLNNSVATSMDQILSGTGDFTQCDFIDQQSAEISGRGYPVIVLMCDDGQQVVNADVYSRQLMQNQDCNTFRAVTSCHLLPEKVTFDKKIIIRCGICSGYARKLTFKSDNLSEVNMQRTKKTLLIIEKTMNFNDEQNNASDKHADDPVQSGQSEQKHN